MKSKQIVIMKKLTNYLLNALIVIFGVILLALLYTVVQTKVLRNDYINFFGYSGFEVQSGSMADSINIGDWLIVKLTKNVKLNDVITYKLNNEYVTHRVIEVYKGTFITKGDANNTKDSPVDQKQVVGKVVKVFTGLGILRKTLFNPVVLVAVIVTLFLFNMAFSKKKASNKKGLIRLNKLLSNILKRPKKIMTSNMKEKEVSTEEFGDYFASDNLQSESYLADVSKVVTENNLLEVSEDKPVTEENIDSITSVDIKDELTDETLYNAIEENDEDKTYLYRVIPVDLSEIDETFLEIAKNEIKDTNKKDRQKVVTEVVPDDITEEEDETLTQISLDFLKTRNKKGKNIIDNAMIIKQEELNEIMDYLIFDDKRLVNRSTIKKFLIDTYIKARYYNIYPNDIEYSGRNTTVKIERLIREEANNLINKYTGNNKYYQNTVVLYTSLLLLFITLDKAKDSISDLKAKREFYKKSITKYQIDINGYEIEKITNDIMWMQKKYSNALNYYLKNLETNMFSLNFNKIMAKKDIYGLELKHNISFSRVYSDYIIDKTYTEGIIAEDKMQVLLNLLSIQIVTDMNLGNFGRKYILYIPPTLYTKEKKFEKLLKMIDDEHAKESVILILTFDTLIKNKKIIKGLKKTGYKFALLFDKEMVIDEKKCANVYIVDYVFVNKKLEAATNMLSFVEADFLERIIYEDITDKIGDFGGNEE